MRHLADGYGGKRVFITGHTGFKGSWLAFWLSELGAEVTGYALPPKTDRDHFVCLDLARRVHHLEGDVRDLGRLVRAVVEARPDYVFHLAAQALVRTALDDPVATFSTNVGGSVNILDAVRQCEAVTALVYVTSDKCYLNKEWLWGYRESDELGGRDPYSASKAAAEMAFLAYQSSYFEARPGFGAASARAGNVIGGGDWSADRILPDCIRALSCGQPISIRNPEATRPWQYVLDPLHGYLMLGLALARDPAGFQGAWNFGPADHGLLTVRDVAEAAVATWGSGTVAYAPDPAGRHEATLLQLSIDKARALLGWRPAYDGLRAIQETVSWYRAVQEGQDPVVVSGDHLARFAAATEGT